MRKRFWIYAALSGIISGGVVLAVAELVALLVARDGSPVLAVGSFVIDIVPRPLKEFAIETFGENDKIVLLGSIGLAVVVAAAIAGVLQLLRPPIGDILLALAGGLAVAAVATRAAATPLAWVPAVVGTVAGVVVLELLVRRLRAWRAAVRSASSGEVAAAATPASGVTPASGASPASGDASVPMPGDASATASGSRPASVDRRAFFVIAAAAAVGAAVVGAGSRVVAAATSSIAGIREALKLPAPRSTVTIPEGAELDIDGLSPLFTPNADFYRVDTALSVPELDPATWALRITGLVDEEVTLTFQQLVDLGLDEYSITLTCVSNEVGGGLLGSARWLGVPVRTVLERAGVQQGADMVLSTSSDGYTASTPLSSLTDEGIDAILAVAMNGEPLPFEHGFPVRMVVPGLYGYVSATKWLVELKVTTFAEDEAYWTPRGYSAEAPIKFSSRIDTPRVGTPVPAGAAKVAGMAWAQTVGIDRVEVSIDNGEWQAATLSAPVNEDTWVQWYLDWEATPGTHYLAARAVNKAGELQVQERAPIAPDGSTGWQSILVTVA